MIPRWSLRVALALLFGLCSACSSFDRRWKTAATSATAERWDGRWTSGKHVKGDGSPEGGRLRAVTEPGPKMGLTAHFHANWLVFSSDYSTAFEPKAAGPRRGAGREFSGTQELPKIFGGVYHYDALLLGDQFTTHYSSSYDHGTFTLHRVDPRKDCTSRHAGH